MIRKRFPGFRIARILGWTAVVTAWATVGIRVVATETATPPLPTPAEPPAEAHVQTEASVPSMPESGLVVIRYTPAPDPESRVVTRVVTQRVVAQSAPQPASSGS
jgi:hypothetical protein